MRWWPNLCFGGHNGSVDHPGASTTDCSASPSTGSSPPAKSASEGKQEKTLASRSPPKSSLKHVTVNGLSLNGSTSLKRAADLPPPPNSGQGEATACNSARLPLSPDHNGTRKEEISSGPGSRASYESYDGDGLLQRAVLPSSCRKFMTKDRK